MQNDSFLSKWTRVETRTTLVHQQLYSQVCYQNKPFFIFGCLWQKLVVCGIILIRVWYYMKCKFIAVLILCILLMGTSGCVTFNRKFEVADTIEEVSCIEIYFIEFSYDNVENIPDSIHPIKKIDNDLYAGLINDLESLDYKDTIIMIAPSDPNFYLYGFIIKITYDSGVYQLVSNSGTVYTYNNEGFVECFHGTVEDEVWNEIIIKYLGSEVFEQYKLPF